MLAATRRLATGAVRRRMVRNYSHSANAAENWPVTQYTTLGNGLRIASEEVHGDTATVGVWVDTGSRYEAPDKNGVAHFLEHTLFKGTGNRTRVQLEKEVENMGGHLNAYTSRESTVFYAKVFKSDVPQTMELLSDILLNSTISAESVERERSVILREMEEVESQVEEVVFDDLHSTAFQGCSLGNTILGPVENIKSLTREDIIDYIQTHYTAPRMVIAGAGVDHNVLVQAAEKSFGKVPQTPPNGAQVVKEPAIFTGSDIRVRYDDMPLAHVTYAFKTGGWNSPDTFALILMQTMLGHWSNAVAGGIHSSSPLVSVCAEKDLAHSISAFNTQYSDVGLFGIHAVAEDKALNDLMYNVTYEMTRLCYEIDEARLQEAKNHLKLNMLAMLDGTTAVCEDIGRQMLQHGRRMHPSEVLARIDQCTADDVKTTARKYLYDQDFALAAQGPIWELPDYNWLRRRTHWLRF